MEIELGTNFTHCHKTNHIADKCFQLHGHPPGFGRGRWRGTQSDTGSSFGLSVHNVNQYGSDGLNPIPHSLPPQLSQPQTLNPQASLSIDQC